jgi:hypothetical protein
LLGSLECGGRAYLLSDREIEENVVGSSVDDDELIRVKSLMGG